MKITPDSSLFTALSSLPTPAEARKRSGGVAGGVGGEQANFADKFGQNQKSPSTRDELIRKALEDSKLRQAAIQKKQQTKAAVAKSVDGEMTDSSARRGSVTREAPFADSDTKPKFVRLGQFVDMRV